MHTALLQQLTSFLKGLPSGDHDILVSNLENVVAYLSEKVSIGESNWRRRPVRRASTPNDRRRRLAQAGKKLNEAVLAQVEHSFQPDTVHGGDHPLVSDKSSRVGEGQQTRGRKAVTDELRDLVLRIARNNPN